MSAGTRYRDVTTGRTYVEVEGSTRTLVRCRFARPDWPFPGPVELRPRKNLVPIEDSHVDGPDALM